MNTANFVSIPAQIFPDQEILVCGQRRWSYGELWQAIQQVGHGLRGLGVSRGDRVAVLQTNSDHYVIAYFATAAIGGVFVPLNYRAKLPELQYMIDTAATRVLLVGHRYLSAIQGLEGKLPSLRNVVTLDGRQPGMVSFEELLQSSGGELSGGDAEDDDPTILMYTSGTTSLPKGVLLTHNDFTLYVCANVELADGTARGTSLVCAPLYHIAGATNVMTNLFTGRKLVLLPQFDAEQWLATVQREKVTHAFLVPTMMKQLIDHPEVGRYDLTSLENVSYGGAAMPFAVIRRAIETFPKMVGFVNAFGQTETTSTLTVLGPEDHRLDGSPEELELRLKRLISIGRPLPDVQVKVVDDEGQELQPGEVGELWVSTPRTMKGYAGSKGEVTNPALDGWLPTRDMGWIDRDGYIFLAGRKDDMIIRGGENIAPAEVESVLQMHPSIEEAAVVGLPDVEWGQRVVAIVTRRAGAQVGEEELMDFCRQRLASFKKPEVIRFVDALPKNQLGKVLKKDLRAQLETAQAL